MSGWHLAQFNLARAVAPLDDPAMADFVARIQEINARADRAPGFVWRLRDEVGDGATYLRPYDDRTLVNLSVWQSVGALRDFTYDSDHRDLLARRRDWFERGSARLALWWVPAGHVPGLAEADERLRLLAREGPTQEAFSFAEPFPPPVPAPAR